MINLPSVPRKAFTPAPGVQGFAGISGGRTSGLMAFLLDPSVVLCFENTGREHPKTYEFVDRIDRALVAEGRRPIVWLEWRPPAVFAAPPREHRFAVVNYATADRTGAPFLGMMRALADYRRVHKGENAVSPWARSRICTAYLKIRVIEHYIASRGVVEYDSFAGLRADEMRRVQNFEDSSTRAVDRRAPLAAVGITKADVNAFWSEQAFDLEIPNASGNCSACFLKDQSDLSELLQDPATDAPWWEAIGDEFANFGGRRFPGYRQLREEWPIRKQIRDAIARGEDPTPEDKRQKAIIGQEKRRARNEIPAFACECEGATALANGADPIDEEAL